MVISAVYDYFDESDAEHRSLVELFDAEGREGYDAIREFDSKGLYISQDFDGEFEPHQNADFDPLDEVRKLAKDPQNVRAGVCVCSTCDHVLCICPPPPSP